jgi:hypothetical protein
MQQARLDREPQRFFPVQEIALAVDEPETVFAKVVSSHCATTQLPGRSKLAWHRGAAHGAGAA